jgi:hypothetical protein
MNCWTPNGLCAFAGDATVTSIPATRHMPSSTL